MAERMYLCVYDYQTGGLWFMVFASSPAEIREKLPALEVVEARPDWMDDEYFEHIRGRAFDVDAPPEEVSALKPLR